MTETTTNVAGQGLTSANSVKPTGARTPADALGEPKRMSTSESEEQESHECPTCGRTFSSTKAVSDHQTKGCFPELEDASWLQEKYVGQPYSIRELADNIGCSRHAVHKALERHGIERRSAHDTNIEYPILHDADWLREQYVDQKKSALAIANEVGCNYDTVYDALRKAEIERRSYSKAHPSDQAGDYGSGWTVTKKEAVREREDRKCATCSMTESEHLEKYDTRLDVHHINGDKTNNSMDNLVALCRRCHLSIWQPMTPLRPQ